MSGYAGQRDTIVTRFNAKWATGNPVAPVPPVSYTNTPVPGVPPEPAAPWVRLVILTGEERHAGVAGTATGEYRNTGIVDIACFIPRDSGSRTAYLLADHAARVFRGWSSGGISFLHSSISEIPEASDSPWYGVKAQCGFTRTRIETYMA